MNSTLRVAAHELRLLWRGRVALAALLMVAALACASAFSAWQRSSTAQELRLRLQAQAEQEFDAQPDRHPHRMVHYGHFVFRPLNPLAAFDPGIDAYAGSVVYLEGHRQNSANFADVRQSSLLLRFGELTPAFVLQTLLPLLLVVLGAGLVARDRESGRLRLLLAQGVAPGALLSGKLLALLTAGLLAAAPAWLTLALTADEVATSRWLMLVLGYGSYLVLWTLAVLLVSSWARSSTGALRYLLGAWVVLVVLMPRIAPEFAALRAPAPTRFETEFAIQRELREMGDSHDENDPYFAAFRDQTLRRYGVTRVEDLPVNYKGLLAVEGERMTSELFERYAQELGAVHARQARVLDGFSLTSPLPALRRLSTTAAQTDLATHQRFLAQAEQHRVQFVQELNRLQAEAVTYADDTGSNDPEREKRIRITAEHWRKIPDFQFVAEPASETVRRALPSLAALTGWLAVLAGGLAWAWSRALRVGP